MRDLGGLARAALGLGLGLALGAVGSAEASAVADADLADLLGHTLRIAAAPVTIGPGPDGALVLDVRLPRGYKWNPGSPFVYRVRAIEGPVVAVPTEARERILSEPRLPVRIPLVAGPGAGEARLTVSTTFYYCREDAQAVCLIQGAIVEQPVRVVPGTVGREVNIRLDAPAVPR
jgi:hypothetical protein